MATVFETRLIGNIGKDAIVKPMERGIIAINFPVAHNKNWKDKRSGESKTKTTWVNCTIWIKDGANLRILDFLKKGALATVKEADYRDGKYIYSIMFDNESWLRDSVDFVRLKEPIEMPVKDKHVFLFYQSDLEKA